MKKILISLTLLMPLSAWGVDCTVAQYGAIQEDIDGQAVQVSGGPTAPEEQVTFTSTSTRSAVFNGRTRYIAFICTAKTHFKMDQNPVATTTNLWVPANTVIYIGVWRRNLRIAFVQG